MLKILSVEQIREIDRATLKEEGIPSHELMERAGKACFGWLKNHFGNRVSYLIICGPGNNGGDGLVIARLMTESGSKVSIFRPQQSAGLSEDHQFNYSRIAGLNIAELNSESVIDLLSKEDEKIVVIDCLFGSGLNRGLEGEFAEIVQQINKTGKVVIAIDIPSGMFADISSGISANIIKASHTLSFQIPRLGFFMAESDEYIGDIHLIDIGLSHREIEKTETDFYQISDQYICESSLYRKRHDHKKTFGHALIVAGSEGKAGAAILAVSACLRSGAGLTTASVPDNIVQSLNISSPEAMTLSRSDNEFDLILSGKKKYTVIGIGPGLGISDESTLLIKKLIKNQDIPIVLDADAITILSENLSWLESHAQPIILTPHPGEFKRLCGEYVNSFEAIEKARIFAVKYRVIIILKGAYTAIVSNEGRVYYNCTGNPGMAKAGSGDVLTGLLTGLIARGYDCLSAALHAVYLHGLAGDLAVSELGMEAIKAGDIIAYLPDAFRRSEKKVSVSFPLPE